MTHIHPIAYTSLSVRIWSMPIRLVTHRVFFLTLFNLLCIFCVDYECPKANVRIGARYIYRRVRLKLIHCRTWRTSTEDLRHSACAMIDGVCRYRSAANKKIRQQKLYDSRGWLTHTMLHGQEGRDRVCDMYTICGDDDAEVDMWNVCLFCCKRIDAGYIWFISYMLCGYGYWWIYV